MSYSVAPMRDVAEQINGLVCVFSDITERKRAEKQLCNLTRNWRAAFTRGRRS